ncbi:hypothetical protein [Marinifilum flexuosum]|uniref:hypothetical protein n=1 Tax=Marinifilum flexuosum TaxID=1117708 RepID=UPI0024957BBF|nr:hypothetical protein [Marinifilum flexuosum]
MSKLLNKYLIALIVMSLFGMPWLYLRHLTFDLTLQETYDLIHAIPGYVNYLTRLIVIVLLIIDFRKEKLKHVVLACVAALFYPLLGIVVFALLMLEKEKVRVRV